MQKSMVIAAFLSAAVGGFGYGFLMMERQVWPYTVLGDLWMYAKHLKEGESALADNTRIIQSALSPVRIEEYRLHLESPWEEPSRGGGGIAALGDLLIGVDRWGHFFEYQDGALVKLPLALESNVVDLSQIDANEDELKRIGVDVRDISTKGFNPANPFAYNSRSFRFLDLELAEIDGSIELFASHYYWYPDKQCKTIRLSKLSTQSSADLRKSASKDDWTTLFETQPCLELDYRNNSPFQSPNAGGRLAYSTHDKILYLSVGDHHLDGYNNPEKTSQRLDMDYGKVYGIQPTDGEPSVHTIGHRNPSGLHVTDAGELLSSEHGPKGGDELNLLKAGGNYGWPEVSRGTQYGMYAWPASRSQGRHSAHERPIYSWLPSPGVSNITEITDESSVWRGDVIVSSLKAASLFRLGLDGGRATYVEQIYLGERARDMQGLENGKLALWTDNGSLMFVEPEYKPATAASTD